MNHHHVQQFGFAQRAIFFSVVISAARIASVTRL
jgi:hypothetical protein